MAHFPSVVSRGAGVVSIIDENVSPGSDAAGAAGGVGGGGFGRGASEHADTMTGNPIHHGKAAKWWRIPPNGSRLSCGALKKKVSFNILRAPPASSAC